MKNKSRVFQITNAPDEFWEIVDMWRFNIPHIHGRVSRSNAIISMILKAYKKLLNKKK